jgi:hypothetical protein
MDATHRMQVEQEALHQLFHIVDTDGGGSITPGEFAVLLQELNCKIDAENARKVIEALVSTDGSGVTHLRENAFVACMTDNRLVDTLVRVGGTEVVKDSHIKDHAWLVKWTIFKKLWANALAGATMLLMLAHTPVSRKVFQYFHCNNLAGKRYLFADYSIRCYSDSWWAFLPVVLVVLVCFTILLPASISVYLYRHWDQLYTVRVQQKVGWLYQAYRRGAEFWQVHDVILKMILTGMLIYIPDGARPTAGAMICIIAVANLNYFRPHKTNVLFWLTELTFVASAFKYITALMIESSAHNPDATEEDIDTVGSLLIGIEIFTIISMLFCFGAAVYVLRGKLQEQDKLRARMRNVLKTHVTMGTGTFVNQTSSGKDVSALDARSWNAADSSKSTKVVPKAPLGLTSSASSEDNHVDLQADASSEDNHVDLQADASSEDNRVDLQADASEREDRNPPRRSKLALRRQETKILAEKRRVEAGSADWL